MSTTARRRLAWPVALAPWLLAAPLLAAELGIEVHDKGGRPVQGAAVTIAGPAGAKHQGRTSDIGRVVFADLAAGEWSLAIEHPDFMRFSGWVDTKPGKIAKETFSTQVATERSWLPLRVTYFAPASREARTNTTSPMSSAKEETTRAPPPPAPAAPSPAARPVTEPAPAPPAVPAGRPAADAPVYAPATTPPAVTPQPAPRDVAAPVAPVAPATPAAAPVPAPRPAPPAAAPPATAATVARGTAATSPSPYRSRALGNCPDCKPGEWGASVQMAAVAGAGCEPGEAARLEAEFTATVAGVTGESWSSREASCRLFAVRLPEGSRFLGYRFEAEDNRRAGDCVGDEPCPVGEARFLAHPTVRKKDGFWVWAIFENRAGSPRLARLTAFFAAPPGWQRAPAN